MSRGLQPNPHPCSAQLQIAIKLLRLSISVLQSVFAVISCFRVYQCDLLHARVIITTYNQHLWLLSPEPLFVGCYKSNFAVVMESLFGNPPRPTISGRLLYTSGL